MRAAVAGPTAAATSGREPERRAASPSGSHDQTGTPTNGGAGSTGIGGPGGAPPPRGADVEISDLRLAFGDKTVFDGLTCTFTNDQISVILGASGCGKSTLLRVMALLQPTDGGRITFGDHNLLDLSKREAQQFRKRIGMMFQHGALLDSMTVFDNVALPLREHTDLHEKDIANAVHEQLEAVGLRAVDALLPGELSGGMKKRVALARAMINKPEILFCDEPVSGLDPLAVRMIEALLVDVSQRARVTMIITSHHISSTLRMADNVVYLINGQAICLPPEEISKSADARVRAFLDAAKPGPLAGGTRA